MIIKRKSQQSSHTSPPPPPPPLPLPLPLPPLVLSGEEESGSEPNLIVREKSTGAQDTAAAEDDATKKSKKTHNSLNRLWSEEDEIIILKGMIDYTSEKKSDPISELNAFHDFIKKDLHVDATRDQLAGKIRKLKNKYTANKGKKRTFSESHHQKLHDLSKLVWGNHSGRREKATGRAAAESGEGEKLTAAAAAAGKRVMSMEERMLIVGEEVYEILGEGGVEGEKEWEKLRVEELELYQKELEVKAAHSKVRIAQTKLVLEAIKRRKLTFV